MNLFITAGSISSSLSGPKGTNVISSVAARE